MLFAIVRHFVRMFKSRVCQQLCSEQSRAAALPGKPPALSRPPAARTPPSRTWQGDVGLADVGRGHEELLLVDEQPVVGPRVPEQPEVPCGTGRDGTALSGAQRHGPGPPRPPAPHTPR